MVWSPLSKHSILDFNIIYVIYIDLHDILIDLNDGGQYGA
jgi:hypothetical protein